MKSRSKATSYTRERIHAVEMYAVWSEQTGVFPSFTFDEEEARKLVDALDHPENRTFYKRVLVVPADAVEEMHAIFEGDEFHSECGVMETSDRANRWLKTVTANEPQRYDGCTVEPVGVFRIQKEE